LRKETSLGGRNILKNTYLKIEYFVNKYSNAASDGQKGVVRVAAFNERVFGGRHEEDIRGECGYYKNNA
jgi:hypothetical protein